MANIGIDLGTTHSLVAVVLGGKARVLLDDEERPLVPSAVRVDAEGVPKAVGYPALALMGEPGGTTFASFKRFMGRSSREVKGDAQNARYQLVDDADGMVRFRAGSRDISPVELSSLVLRLLHARAEECLFARPGGAVITVPAYFDDAQRQATRDAAKVAGIEVLRLLNEPTAAAIAYGLQTAQDGRRIAVYDLGGGTFDVSILLLDDGVFQVLATAGDTHLGGDDFDRALAHDLVARAGVVVPDDQAWRRLLRSAEGAKRALSAADTCTVVLPFGEPPLEVEVSRAEFERLIAADLERTGRACRQALADAGLRPDEIDEVVLVGGSTRVPRVRAFVGELFGRQPHCELDPDLVVALGAAVQADLLSGAASTSPDLLLLDVLPLSLGLETMGGVTERLLPRSSAIPASVSTTFTTHVADQTAVVLHVVQGERELARDNRTLAQFILRIPPMPAGLPRVRVDFSVDADGILSVSATEEHTGTAASIQVEARCGLAEEEIERMIDEAIDHAEADMDARLLIEARVEGEQILGALERALVEDGAMLAGDEGDLFAQAAAALAAALQGTDRRAIQAAGERVDRLTAPFAQRRIERDLAQAIQGRLAETVADRLGLETEAGVAPTP
jgi:molecular chaperone HscA